MLSSVMRGLRRVKTCSAVIAPAVGVGVGCGAWTRIMRLKKDGPGSKHS